MKPFQLGDGHGISNAWQQNGHLFLDKPEVSGYTQWHAFHLQMLDVLSINILYGFTSS